jgi:hypothetical protein
MFHNYILFFSKKVQENKISNRKQGKQKYFKYYVVSVHKIQ